MNYRAGDIRTRTLRRIDEDQIRDLADVLVDCVEGGASVSFLLPITREKAIAFWTKVADDVHAGRRLVAVAEDPDGIVGTAQLLLDLPENQPHRADVAKVLVHRRGRRHGLATILMRILEFRAIKLGRTLLVLDTTTGGDAERLYTRMGWTPVGEIPHFALNPDGVTYKSTTVFYKDLTTDLFHEGVLREVGLLGSADPAGPALGGEAGSVDQPAGDQ
ncbi:GNAT family N-acetyltransferase [Nakamurella sp. YIM 132087]|uniref:GNAT family N-acetyltransferase n=1 Tax=Nakamurella alba TaxID=2665158 RepID=A0A7K1FLF3_9ACTN|nr:GNAT family N-acetyltransferase [Nakamurella alba]MTD14972.1 GNAT family N-acetyltransferase [Nakamurella alba]